MDLNKILSADSPPQKRRHLSFPPFRWRMMHTKPNTNPSDFEAAELMMALSTSPPPAAAFPNSCFPAGRTHIDDSTRQNHNHNHQNHHQHPPIPGNFRFTAQPGSTVDPLSYTPSLPPPAGLPGQFTPETTATQGSASRLSTAMTTHHHLHNPNSPEESRKGRRVNTTKRLSPSPSGKPCPNCGVEVSTLWRTCKLQSGSAYLCNACGLRYKKGKFCPLCFRVYYDVDTNQLQWRQCQNCLNWTHKVCLEQRNILSGTPYLCINCKRHAE